jgi:putative transposase
MREWESQAHVRWSCLYHIVIVTKYRKKSIYESRKKEVGKIIRKLCGQIGVELVEGHAMPDHVHLVLSIPPKFSVAQVVGKLKGKSAILIHNEIVGRQRNFGGCHFWARGYCASTVGLDEDTIRAYVRNQEEDDKRLDS